MAKVITLDLTQTTAEQRQRVQAAVFNEVSVEKGYSNASEVTQADVVEWIENFVKKSVIAYERTKNSTDFQAAQTDVALES